MKWITVPVDREAEMLLDTDECPDEKLAELNLSQEELDALWKTGLFQELNTACNVLIDDFEDEKIRDKEALAKGLKIVNHMVRINPHDDILPEIATQFEKALQFNTGVYFFF